MLIELSLAGRQVHESTITNQKRPRLLFNLQPQQSRDWVQEFLDRELKYGGETRFSLLLHLQHDCKNQFSQEVYEVRRSIRKLLHLVNRQEVIKELLLEEGRKWKSPR